MKTFLLCVATVLIMIVSLWLGIACEMMLVKIAPKIVHWIDIAGSNNGVMLQSAYCAAFGVVFLGWIILMMTIVFITLGGGLELCRAMWKRFQ